MTIDRIGRVKEVIEQHFNVLVDMVQESAGSFDPDTGDNTPVLTTTSNIPAVIQQYQSDQIDGTLVLLNDRRITIAAKGLSITPVVGNRVTHDGRTLEVVNVMKKYIGNEIAAYELQVRQ